MFFKDQVLVHSYCAGVATLPKENTVLKQQPNENEFQGKKSSMKRSIKSTVLGVFAKT
jgi:hypothetical protein